MAKNPIDQSVTPLTQPMNTPTRPGLSRHVVTAVLAMALIPVAALALTFESGPLRGSFDSTFSYGGLYRLGN